MVKDSTKSVENGFTHIKNFNEWMKEDVTTTNSIANASKDIPLGKVFRRKKKRGKI